MKNSNRTIWIDYIKAFAVILMLLGHCIEFGNGYEYRTNLQNFYNPIYVWIYSFHMPLFAIISGFFLVHSISTKTFMQCIWDKVKKVLIPIFCWQFIIVAFNYIHSLFRGGGSLKYALLSYLNIYNNMWFLWATFFCSCLIICIHFWVHDNIFVYLICIALTWLIPYYSLQLMLWLLPFFIFGYYCARGNLLEKLSLPIIIICVVIHVLVLLNWSPLFYIYQSIGAGQYVFGEGCSLLQHILVNVVRLVSGLSGSIAIIGVFYTLRMVLTNGVISNIAELISRYSMSIYVSSVYIFNAFLRDMTTLQFNFVHNIVQTIVILLLSMLFSKVLYSNRYTRFAFWGRR